MSHHHEGQILVALEKRHGGPKAFRALSRPYWQDGALSSKDKHLLAVAIGQVTRCAYCIEHHAEIAKTLGAGEAEAIAASYITAALEALGSSRLRLHNEEIAVDDEPALVGTSIAKSRYAFVNTVFNDATLSLNTRWTIAAAVSYAKGQEDWRVVFHDALIAQGVLPAVLEEAYAIAVVLRSGAVYAHTLPVAQAFNDA